MTSKSFSFLSQYKTKIKTNSSTGLARGSKHWGFVSDFSNKSTNFSNRTQEKIFGCTEKNKSFRLLGVVTTPGTGQPWSSTSMVY